MSTSADARLFDAELVIYRLEEAGAALLALPGTGWSTRLRSSSLDIVRAAIESYGWTASRIRPPVPSAARISRMDEALSWIPLIPIDRYVLRRIVAPRSLVHPITERHLYPWRRLGAALGADHKAGPALARAGDRPDRRSTERSLRARAWANACGGGLCCCGYPQKKMAGSSPAMTYLGTFETSNGRRGCPKNPARRGPTARAGPPERP